MRVLLVEDEKALSSAICQVLKREKFAVDPVYTGTDGLDYARPGLYDAIILDVMLPGMDGFTVLRTLRQEGVRTPVCMLTARSGQEDRVHGLNTGADYYLSKPFQMAELIACLRAITRRKEDAPVMELSFGDVRLDQQGARLIHSGSGQEVRLGGKEYQLMELLLRNPRQLLSKDTIFDRVWGYDSEADVSTVEVYVSFLRKKLAFIGSGLRIRAARGIGYSLEEDA